MKKPPINVQVAEALGWKEIVHTPDPKSLWPDGMIEGAMQKAGFTHVNVEGYARLVPRYDTDWAATGPLIEPWGISIVLAGGEGFVAYRDKEAFYLDSSKLAQFGYRDDCPPELPHGWGETALLAVCNLILALKAAGKL